MEQAAYAKHGGPGGLERARLQRIDDRTEARKRKRAARETKARPCPAACAAPWLRRAPARLQAQASMQTPHWDH